MNPASVSFITISSLQHSTPGLPQVLPSFPIAAKVLPRNYLQTLVHDMRNPLTNINLAIDVLKDLEKGKELQVYFDLIMRNSARINEMISGLLADQSAMKTVMGMHSVQSLLDEILTMNKDRIQLRGVDVQKNYSLVDTKKEFDHSQLKVALNNIIVNAIEAMPIINSTLELTTKLIHDVCYVIIKDNGIGLSPKDLANLFTPYFTKRPGGLGLGLSSTQSILESNHVGVHVRSELGKGTSFILSFKIG